MNSQPVFSDHHGAVGAVSRIAGFQFIDSRYVPLATLPRHAHQAPCLCVVVSGRLAEDLGTRTVELPAGAVAFRPAGVFHGNRFGNEGAHCLIVEVPGAWITRVTNYGGKLDEPRWASGGHLRWLGTRLYRGYQHTGPAAPLVIEGIMLEIAAELVGLRPQPALPAPSWLEDAREAAHANYARPVRVRQLAARAGVHPVHLARAFRRRYGCGVGEYVHRLRIEAACERLTCSDAPIARIALDLGYSSQAHFSRTFRQVTGVTPSQYRAARRL